MVLQATKFLLFFFLILSISSTKLEAQVAINTDGSDPDSTAILDLKSTDAGILIPRMSTAQRDSIISPAKGLMVFVNTDSSFYYFDGSNWQVLGASRSVFEYDAATNKVQVDTSVTNNIATDDFIFGAFNLGETGNSLYDNRFFFDKSKGAFRAGAATGDQWDNYKRGEQSFAAGYDVTASGDFSVTLGEKSRATGLNAIALGRKTYAYGDRSFAWGNQARANAEGTVAMGQNARANAPFSYAVGAFVEANGPYSVAVGRQAIASDVASIALGDNVEASGQSAVVIGSDANASGYKSFSVGFQTNATGQQAMAIGHRNTSSARYSMAFGVDLISSGYSSVAIGQDVSALSSFEQVIGRYNTLYTPSNTAGGWVGTDRLFTVGNGTGSISRSDAFTILKNGFIGIGTSSPSTTLEIQGSLRLVDGNQDNGYVLTSDASGNATWQALNAGSDNQNLTGATLSGTTLEIDIENGYSASVNLSGLVDDADADPSNELQTISQSGNDIILSNGGGTISVPNDGDWTISGNHQYSAVSGNVGIGVMNPVAKLHVSASTIGDANGIKLTQGSANSLIYHNASNDLVLRKQMQTDQLVLDDNGNIGAGTSTPGEKLHVEGGIRMVDGNQQTGFIPVSDANGTMTWTDPNAISAADVDWIVDSTDMYSGVSGNVGIGVASPQDKLHVAGDVLLNGNVDGFSAQRKLTLAGKLQGNALPYASIDFQNLDFNDADIDYVGASIRSHNNGTSDDGDLRFFTTSNQVLSEAMRIHHLGNVGIGAVNPQDKLHVVGNIRMEDGNQQSGYIPVSDAAGTMTWTDPSSISLDDDWIYAGNDMYTGNTGNVGIGDATPKWPATISSNNQLFDSIDLINPDLYALTLTRPNGTNDQGIGIGLGGSNSGDHAGVGIAFKKTGFNSLGDLMLTVKADNTSFGPHFPALTIKSITGNVGLGTTTPDDKLHVDGAIRMVDGNQQSGYIPVSDANGTMSWTDPTTITTAADGDGNSSNEIQSLSLTGNTLAISGSNDVDLSGYLSSDDQGLTGATLTGTTLQIDIEDGTSASVDLLSLVDDVDADTTNELQTLSRTGTNLNLSHGGGTISIVDDDWQLLNHSLLNANSSGRVGIGVQASSNLSVKMGDFSSPPLLDANSSGGFGALTFNPAWQSFTAINTGYIDEIILSHWASTDSIYKTLQIYEGQGTGDTLLFTSDSTLLPSGTAFNLTFPVNNILITAGNEYTIHLSNNHKWQLNSGDPYAGGDSNSSGSDYAFQVILVPQNNGFNVTDNGVAIGRSLAEEELDVNGNIRMRSGASSGYIPVSDANGTMVWTDPTTISDGDWTINGSDIHNSNTGNVGVGTPSPDTKFHLSSSTSGDNTGIKLTQDIYNSLIHHNNSGDLVIRKAINPDQLVLDEDGGIGIGTAAPNSKLHVTNNIAVNSSFVATIENTANTGWSNGLLINAGEDNQSVNNRFISFVKPNGNEIGAVRQVTSSSVDYNTTSDERLKTNIQPTIKGLDELLQIEVKDYVYKEDLDKPQTGFIAQQVFKHYPNAVSPGGENVKTDPWMMDYGKMTPLLVKAIQEQQEQIEALKAENSSLELALEKMKSLEAKLAMIEALLETQEKTDSNE